MDELDVAAGVLSMAVDVNAAGDMQDEVQPAVPGPVNSPTSSFEQSAKDYRRDADFQRVNKSGQSIIRYFCSHNHEPMPNTP